MPASGPWASSVAFAAAETARHPLLPLSRPVDDACAGFAFATDRALVFTPLRTRPLGHARGLRYRGPRRLPGPDLHRPVALSLSFGYVMSNSLSSWRPNCWTHSAEPWAPYTGR